ncbi:MAG: glutamate--tRNA ligase, partial [Dethiobacteria bacterium]|nr:glutamate--tRNA ligase [Dethiobacteria bacterium]
RYNALSEALGVSLGQLIQPTRLALTGRMGGPGLFEIMELLGRDKTVARLERAALFIDEMLK